jgi:predicted transcriptional regulator
MKKFNLPKRVYCNGDKKMVSWRLPEALLKEIEKVAEARGWNATDVVATALDQFVQWHRSQKTV